MLIRLQQGRWARDIDTSILNTISLRNDMLKLFFCMAKPIKETPILTGKDAERFVSEMQRVDNLSAEQRKSNYAQLMAQYKDATRNIELQQLRTLVTD